MYPRVSWSALDRHERCSSRHRLHVERKRTLIPVEHVLVGNSMHYGLSAAVETGIPVVEAAMWDFQRRVYEDKPKWNRGKLAEEAARIRDGGHAVETALAELGRDRINAAWIMRTEVRLLRAFKGWAIDGYLDLMVGSGESVWDLKTGRWHADQLVFYDLLVRAVLGHSPKQVGIIEPFGRGLVPVTVSDEHRQDMQSRVERFVRRVKAEDWAYEGYPDECYRCPSKPWCVKFDAARSGSFGA